MPELFDNNSIEQWVAEGGVEIAERALNHARKLLATQPGQSISPQFSGHRREQKQLHQPATFHPETLQMTVHGQDQPAGRDLPAPA